MPPFQVMFPRASLLHMHPSSRENLLTFCVFFKTGFFAADFSGAFAAALGAAAGLGVVFGLVTAGQHRHAYLAKHAACTTRAHPPCMAWGAHRGKPAALGSPTPRSTMSIRPGVLHTFI